MSGSQAGPRGPAVTEGSECERIMYAGSDQHTVRHTWRLDTERGLQLTTELKDKRTRGGWKLVSKKYVEAFENKLSKLAKDEADAVMEAKREWAKRKGIARKRQSSADLNVSCPVLAAIAASRPSMTTRAAKDSSKGTPADPPEVRHFFVYIFLSLNYSCSVSNAPLLCVLPCVCHVYSRWPALFSIFATCTAVIPAEVTCTSMSMYQVYVYTFSRALLHFSSCCTAVERQFVCTCHDTAVASLLLFTHGTLHMALSFVPVATTCYSKYPSHMS